MNISFEGKRVLVTGAGQGIGKAIVKRLVEAKATVFALSKTEKNLNELKKECPNINILCVDLRDWNATRKAVKTALPIDLVVNNAAIAVLKDFFKITEDDLDITNDVNVKSIVNVVQVVAEDLIRRKVCGNIVNISSQASKAALKDHTAYCASKAAVDALTRNMAVELGPYNIRINSVNPTVVLTEMGKLGWSDPKKANEMISKIPLRRFAEVEEVVDAVIYLLSNHSSMINGTYLPVDGGFLAT